MNSMLVQAFGAMMRGENPSDYLKRLAQTNPKFQEMTQGMSLDDLEGTATELYRQNNQDMDAAKNKLTDFAKSFIH